MKRVAYGCSKLLHFHVEQTGDRDWAYVIDNFSNETTFASLPVQRSDVLREENPADVRIYIFAVANSSLVAIIASLAALGFRLGEQVFLYSELFADRFAQSVERQLGWTLDRKRLAYATSYTLNSRKPIHTTIGGTWLFLEALHRAAALPGAVAEVGAYEGGNVLCSVHSGLLPEGRSYYLFDSFDGFPDISAADPEVFGRGAYKPERSVGEIVAPFRFHDQVRILKGFVPETFAHVPDDESFALVFYDCDLYQPALDTYAFAWERMPSGGILLIHDYFAPPGGFAGVRRATDEFFKDRGAALAAFWETTMAVVIKP